MENCKFELPTKEHAMLLVELTEKAAANGPSARKLADIYDAAKAALAAFDGKK